MKSYLKEIAVFKRLQEMQKAAIANEVESESLVGFPEMVSFLESNK